MLIFARIFASLGLLFYYKIFNDKDLLENLKTAPNGLRYKEISKQSIAIPIKQKFYFRISKETLWHRFCKKLGLGVEFQTGHPEFDQTYYIEADHKSLLNLIQMNEEFKKLVMQLASLGVNSIQSTGRGVLKIETQGKGWTNIFDEFLKLQELIDGVSVSSKEKDSFFQSAYFLELIIFGLGFYAITAIGIMKFDDGQIHLEPFGLFFPGLILGLLTVLFWILFASLLLKKSSRAPVLLFESLGALFLTFVVTGPQVVFDLNQALDSSQTEAVMAKVEGKSIVRRQRRTEKEFYVILNIPQNRYDIPRMLRVSTWDWDQFAEGAGVAILVGQGFFDSPYIAGFSPAIFPEQPSFKISQQEVKALETYAPAPLTEWENLPDLTWKEEHYASGKLRQRVPMMEGLQHGIASYWHENGVKYAEIPWVNGKENGKFTLFREDGSIDQSLSYLEGELHGVSTWYDQKGQVISKGVYQKGKLVKDLLK